MLHHTTPHHYPRHSTPHRTASRRCTPLHATARHCTPLHATARHCTATARPLHGHCNGHCTATARPLQRPLHAKLDHQNHATPSMSSQAPGTSAPVGTDGGEASHDVEADADDSERHEEEAHDSVPPLAPQGTMSEGSMGEVSDRSITR